MNTKKDHIDLINEKGEFPIKCSTKIFSDEELELLQKYGYWFEALSDGTLEPFTELQRKFIEVANNNAEAISFEEKAWIKYLGRKRLETEKPEMFKLNYSFDEDSFFSRSDYYKLHNYKNQQF